MQPDPLNDRFLRGLGVRFVLRQREDRCYENLLRGLVPIVVALLGSTAEANEGVRTVTGVVIDSSVATPVVGATISSDTGSAVTDEGGRFSNDLPRDAEDLIVLAESYETQFVQLESDADIRIRVVLVRLDDIGGEVIEIFGTDPAALEKPKSYELGPEVIRRVPGSGNDALKALQTMPGVGRVPYGMGGLVLRGTSPRDSNVFLDGIEVPLLYHFGGLASFYPSSTLQSLELIPGGYSSEYGRGQGGIVMIESSSGSADHWRFASELSMVDLAVHADGPGGKRSTWSIGVRRSVVDAFLPLFSTEVDITAMPRYYDAQLRYDVQLSSDSRLAAHLFGSDDEIGLIYGERMDRTFRYGTQFARFGLTFEQQWKAAELTVSPWVGLDEFSLESTSQRLTSNNTPYGGRVRYTREHPRGSVSGGIDLSAGDYKVVSVTEVDPGFNVIEGSDDYFNGAFWLEGFFRFANGAFNVKPGARVESYSLSGETVIDPRLVLTHELGTRVMLRESLGVFHQPPSIADSLWGNEDLESSNSIQATAGGEVALAETVSLAVTGFYAKLRNLPVDDPTAETDALRNLYHSKIGALASGREFIAKQFGTFSVLTNTGSGENYGVELMSRYVGARGFAWIAYTASRARRRNGHPLDNDWHRYVLDQPHVVTLVGSLKLGASWQIGARGRYASGNPFTPILGGLPDGEFEFNPIYGEELSERLPEFYQLDLRVDHVWKRGWGTINLFVDVQNVTRRKNEEGRVYEEDYSSYETSHGLPLFPAFGLSYIPAPD